MRQTLDYVVRLTTLIAVLLSCLDAQTPNERVHVSREQVAAAMWTAGFDVQLNNLQLLSPVTAVPGAVIKVLAVSERNSDEKLIRLGCAAPRQCLPFYALAHGLKPESDELKPTQETSVSARRVHRTTPVVARGQRVSVLIESTEIRVVLTAVCLEDGVLGQTIRLRSTDRKRTYRGEVINSSTVRASFQGL